MHSLIQIDLARTLAQDQLRIHSERRARRETDRSDVRRSQQRYHRFRIRVPALRAHSG